MGACGTRERLATCIGLPLPLAARCSLPRPRCLLRLQVDSVAWVAPSALLVSCKLMAAGGEESFAPLAMLSWEGADPAQGAVDLSGGRRCQPGCGPAIHRCSRRCCCSCAMRAHMRLLS